MEKLENPGDTVEKPEGPSPVSVLEPFFLEDIISPGCTTSDHGKYLYGNCLNPITISGTFVVQS